MGLIYVVRRAVRRGLLLPMAQSKANPSLVFLLDKKTDRSELDELVRASLEKQGIRSESEVHAVVDKAEEDYENRIKVQEASRELHRLMAERERGMKLMQVGNKKWKTAFYPSKKGR